MLCMTQYICAPLQSAGGFILEGDWTPTKTKLLQLTTYRVGVLSPLKINTVWKPHELLLLLPMHLLHFPFRKPEPDLRSTMLHNHLSWSSE